mgnify:FL=1
MDQQFLNWVYSGILMAFGWFAKTLWDADKEIRDDLMKLREELPKEYVSKDDYRDDIREIKDMLKQLFDLTRLK